MNNTQRQNNDPIFEMILNNIGGEPETVLAKPASFDLPDAWHEEHNEGQLAVDVAQTDKKVLVVSTMAGAMAEKIEVYVHNDLLTIRGLRQSPFVNYSDLEHFHQECYWGKFSRTIVLPVHVKGDLAKAQYRNGLLLIEIPKQNTDRKIPIVIIDE